MKLLPFTRHGAWLALLALPLWTAQAQNVYVNGATLTVQPGATLLVADSLAISAGGALTIEGTLQLGGSLTNAGTLTASGWVLLRNGRLLPGAASLAQVRVLGGPGLLRVPQDVVIGQQLVVEGMVRTGRTAAVQLGAGATLSGEGPGHYVQGNVRVTRSTVTGPTDFGLGATLDGSGQNLGTVSITRTAGLQAADLSYGTNLGAGARGIDRVWTIEAAQAPTAPVPLALSWLPDDDNGLSGFGQARVWRQEQPAAAWQAAGPYVDASARSISISTAAFGRFTVSNAANPLPVVLLSFTAEREGEAALLRWATAQERNSAYFAVESSPDGRTFREIGRIGARGTSTQRSEYQLRDANLSRYAAPLVYYRLRQVDQDGTATLSEVRTLAGPAGAELLVQAYPNPTATASTLLIRAAQAGPATLRLTDALGRTVLQRELHLTAGNQRLELPEAAHWPPGVYALLLRQAGQLRTLRLVRE
ncbi:T9SS type A sorting domain-containing protein [Hymenobacter sp. 15J16-1T3B]|uniref:T9SS type A sorting domain-containing protein n=1 Tax=Hymenobacter sp. 15J16-1T3B TaxID=2886941 RepID=UPI001D10B451|nr:T9SS type A sorting domain-containing protein [Hymenobacter sp. 15J16-1T3B]MCC3159827.1 T9SS type A sorting domain-containing protein [Hymenobacter sp. 15J16-1T3B]